MKPTLASTAVLLLTLAGQADAQTLVMGVGLEWEGAFTKTFQYEEEAPGSSTYVMNQVGPATYGETEFRTSLSLRYRATEAFWLGARMTHALSVGHSNTHDLGWFAVLVPRVNVLAKYEVTDWLAIGVEAPYNPGLSLEFFKQHYFFIGSDDLTGTQVSSPSHLSVAYEYTWGLQ